MHYAIEENIAEMQKIPCRVVQMQSSEFREEFINSINT